ncbi:MAG: type II secretion system protein [Campylobacter sp.]|nr:type II secretion system protein [Campylobacter sp.]
MKKGFTMIELIFVIVILGILASVAVPRLAGTKADAEESAAVANLRTLISDANTYYVATGDISDATTWSEITNVPLTSATSKANTAGASIKVGGKGCIDVQFVPENATDKTPAHIKFTQNNDNKTKDVCKQVLASESIKAYFASKVPNVTLNGEGAMPIGSNIKLER